MRQGLLADGVADATSHLAGTPKNTAGSNWVGAALVQAAVFLLPQRLYDQERDHADDDIDQREGNQHVVAAGGIVDQATDP